MKGICAVEGVSAAGMKDGEGLPPGSGANLRTRPLPVGRPARPVVAAASGCYNELAQIHKVSRHPLSLRLVLEDMLMRYARAIAGVRG